MKKKSPQTKAAPSKGKHCNQPPVIKRRFAPNVEANRMRIILSSLLKWANGTEIKYMFIEGDKAQQDVVRMAFKKWKNLGIGISFKEVTNIDESMLRIGFDQTDGSWSYVGRDNLAIRKKERTMNFGWDLTENSYGMTTALHEIGHAIGFQHEHQSPFSGITWNTGAVYKEFSQPPNSWSKKDIDLNIINKLPANQVLGTQWDPKSIMEYEFGPGLVLQPTKFAKGIFPPGTLSDNDIATVKKFYPEIKTSSIQTITTGKPATIKAAAGGQENFYFMPATTKSYTFQTKGDTDTVMVIHEVSGSEKHYMAGDDDSGLDKNSKIKLPLVKGRKYLVNIKVTFAPKGKKGTLLIS